MCEKIIVLQDGSVFEQGRPEDLIEKDGLFNHMLKLQRISSEWKY